MKRFGLMNIFAMVMLLVSQGLLSQVNKRNVVQAWNTDTSKHVVSLNEIMVLLKRDAIKPVDSPSFIGRQQAEKIYYENEPVISIVIGNKAKAYPLGILIFHEIVNDEIDSSKFVVTYCPLCNTSNVFSRELNYNHKKYILDFGTSGMLRKSNLVMWDRQTESWWQQVTREAIAGALSGAYLKQLPSMLLSVKEFFNAYPDGKILSINGSTEMKYGMNPYEKYDDLKIKKPMLFFDDVDTRLPAMERVVGLDINSVKKAYPFSRLRETEVISDNVAGKAVIIFFKKGQVSAVDARIIKDSKDVGSATVFSPESEGIKLTFKKDGEYFVDEKTESKWDITGKCVEGKFKGNNLKPISYSVEFSFAWFAFYKDSLLY